MLRLFQVYCVKVLNCYNFASDSFCKLLKDILILYLKRILALEVMIMIACYLFYQVLNVALRSKCGLLFQVLFYPELFSWHIFAFQAVFPPYYNILNYNYLILNLICNFVLVNSGYLSLVVHCKSIAAQYIEV